MNVDYEPPNVVKSTWKYKKKKKEKNRVYRKKKSAVNATILWQSLKKFTYLKVCSWRSFGHIMRHMKHVELVLLVNLLVSLVNLFVSPFCDIYNFTNADFIKKNSRKRSNWYYKSKCWCFFVCWCLCLFVSVLLSPKVFGLFHFSCMKKVIFFIFCWIHLILVVFSCFQLILVDFAAFEFC